MPRTVVPGQRESLPRACWWGTIWMLPFAGFWRTFTLGMTDGVAGVHLVSEESADRAHGVGLDRPLQGFGRGGSGQEDRYGRKKRDARHDEPQVNAIVFHTTSTSA